MNIYLILLALCTALSAAVTDLRSRKIPNWLTYSGIMLALGLRMSVQGWSGLKEGLAGILLAGGLFFVMFLLGGMGGGDVKLMATMGAAAGPQAVMPLIIAAALAGGLLSLTLVIYTRHIRQTLRNIWTILRHHLGYGLRPHPALNVGTPSNIRVPFGVAVAMGTLYCVSSAVWWR
ncbi:MAG: prepilin peptidase [Acidobacteriales bacterium]|nr:prepilin peptidase [Terriglobales bacterium]